MALSSNALAALLFAKFESKLGKIPKKAKRVTEKLTEAIAEAVVEHLKSNAVVTLNASVVTTTNITPANGGLQRDPVTPFAPTLAPTTPQTLAGTGVVTGTGSIT